MTNFIQKTDVEVKTDVLCELKYEPSVKATDIGVLVKDGAVTLTGYTVSYGEKRQAVCAAKRVAGVKGIANDIEVKLPSLLNLTDGDIAAAVAHHIDHSTVIPTDSVKATVREGWITLEGEVKWWYQKNVAEQILQNLSGVRGISNLILIKPQLAKAEVETAIKSAFQRSALLDADQIEVEAADNKVVLRGKMRNYAEVEEAERVAWSAPGVFSVDNQLTVKEFSFVE